MTGYPYPVLDLKHLEQQPVVLESRKHCLRRCMDAILNRANVIPKIVMEIENFETSKRLVEIGYAMAFIKGQYIGELIDVANCEVYSIPKRYRAVLDRLSGPSGKWISVRGSAGNYSSD